MNLLVVGTVAYDAIETPFGKTDKILGGAGTYIALAASFFTNKINLVSVVGEDFEQKYLKLLQKHKINIDGVQIIRGGKTFFWAGKYHNDMNTRDTLATELNTLADFDPIVPDSYKDCDFLMLGNLTPNIQIRVIEQLSRRPRLIVLDTMNYWMNNCLADLKKVLRKIDVLTINDEEARQLSGEYSLVKASRKILSMGPKYLIIKKGEHGALLFDNENVFFAPALPLEDVFDPTGAGDTFAGGFIGHIAKTGDISFTNLKRAVIFGSALASFSVEKFGTERLTELNLDDLGERIEQFVELVNFQL
jgi:sugar/nucleoside kinase (ribokinase family)